MTLRRAPVVIGATLAGLAGVISYQPHAKLAGRAVRPAGIQASAPPPRTRGPAPAQPAPRAVPRTVTIVGADAPNQYGDVQVRVKMSAKKIVSVDAVALPGNDPRSQEISTVAGPLLAQQARAAQSARIDGVSGASYTSDGYRRSLQSALDQLGSAAGGTGSA